MKQYPIITKQEYIAFVAGIALPNIILGNLGQLAYTLVMVNLSLMAVTLVKFN